MHSRGLSPDQGNLAKDVSEGVIVMSEEKQATAFQCLTLTIPLRIRYCNPEVRSTSMQAPLWSMRTVALLVFISSIMLACSEAIGGENDGTNGFDFNDGTTQGWTMGDAIVPPAEIPLPSNFSYDWSDISDYPDEPESAATGDGKGSMQFHTAGGHGITGPNSPGNYWAIGFSSPDLSASPAWQRAAGFSVQIADNMSGPGTDIYVNLHVFFSEPNSERVRHFANFTGDPLPPGEWSLQSYNWHEPPDSLPSNITIHSIMIVFWGAMSSGSGLAGSIYIDDITPIKLTSTFYVDDDDGGPGENGSLEHPFDTIQEALDVASDGDSIVVKDGVYKGQKNWGIDFEGKAVVVRSQNGPANCIVERQPDQNEEIPCFSFLSGETEKAMLKGLTITGSAGAPALTCRDSNPTILECVFRSNNAMYGGAVYCEDSNPIIQNCAFVGNNAERGGALAAIGSKLALTNCTFTDNNANIHGGSIYLRQSEADLTNCILWRNYAPVGEELALEDSSNVTVSYSVLGKDNEENCLCDAASILYRAEGNVAVDPLLATDGYHLLAGSPCIDRGEPTGAYWESTDIDSASRLFNARVDIGSDEFSPKISNVTQKTYADGIQEAIDQAADGDIIVVPNGVYAGKGNHNIDFLGKAITIRSSGGPMRCIIDCHGRKEQVDGRIGFTFAHGEGPDSVLDGFTIRNGYSIIGAAIFIRWSSPTIRNCRFVYNWANDHGGGVACSDGSNPAFVNCLFLNNAALGGGGLSILGGEVKIDNCTFIYNTARTGSVGGAVRCSDGSTEISNCIFWNNVVQGNSGNQIAMQNLTNKSTRVSITHSSVMGGREDVYEDEECRLDWGVGNIDVDPMLTPDGHLRSGSPCIDAGTFLGTSERDWEAETRIYGEGVDIGCDEFADSDLDQLPDYWELEFFGSETGAIANEDVDGDTFSNLVECTLFGSNPVSPPYFVNGDSGSDAYDGQAADHGMGLIGPKRTIQAGINAAGDGDTVLVAAGMYSGLGNVNLLTWGRPIVVHAMEGPESTIIDCNGLGRGFAFLYNETPATVVSGFTVTRGMTPPYLSGGAMVCWMGANPRIRNCVLTNSEAGWGGGLYSAVSSPIIENCRIENNSPTGVEIGYGSMHLEGINRVEGNDWVGGAVMLAGAGTLKLESDVNLHCVGTCRIRCDINGPGFLNVNLNASLVIEDDAVIDLAGAGTNGKINCDGLLRVRNRAQIRNTEIAISRASFEGDVDISNNVINAEVGAPYGQFFIEDTVTISGNEIHADGDRYMDLDPAVFAGVISDNRIYVTITEGRDTVRGGLLELRGKDEFCSVGSTCQPGIFRLPSVPGFDTTTWTIERLELVPGAKVSLTNRFAFQESDPSGFNEVIYVKDLVLGNGSVLNTAFNRLYYENLEDRGGSIVNMPLLGFSLNVIRFDNENEFVSRVVHNNFIHPQTSDYNRTHIMRTHGPTETDGAMRMVNLLDQDPKSPNYGTVVNAKAKGVFAKSSEDRLLIAFEYLFETDDPGTELVVYLSDTPDLQAPRDPNHYVEVGHLSPPLRGRPGSVGSGRFGLYHKYVARERLDFIRGTRVELELVGPDGTSVLIDNWDPTVQCSDKLCLDLNGDKSEDFLDLVPLMSEIGKAASLEGAGSECLDGVLCNNRYIDTADLASLHWSMSQEFSHLCPDSDNPSRSLPLTGRSHAPVTLGNGLYRKTRSGYQFSPGLLQEGQGTLLILGKRQWRLETVFQLLSEQVFVLDHAECFDGCFDT